MRTLKRYVFMVAKETFNASGRITVELDPEYGEYNVNNLVRYMSYDYSSVYRGTSLYMLTYSCVNTPYYCIEISRRHQLARYHVITIETHSTSLLTLYYYHFTVFGKGYSKDIRALFHVDYIGDGEISLQNKTLFETTKKIICEN